jgi:hypothetical protein
MPNTYVIPQHFNVAGPCVPGEHYMLDAVARLPEARKLALGKHFFVIHAARQSGKTTLLRVLTREINEQGQFYALYCSLESAQGLEGLEEGIASILDAIGQALEWSPEAPLRDALASFDKSGATIAISRNLTHLCAALNKPLIIFFDEADCLSGQVLITFLRQLRNGYVNRDASPFPWSISLIGMRDIRDFKANLKSDSNTLGSASPFNIVTEALTLANFTQEQIADLYMQHTAKTGQLFEKEATERAYYWSQGQPWLVNALARQVIEKDMAGDYTEAVTGEHIDTAAEAIMRRRDTHIDSLLERLKEPRLRKVIEPVLFGGDGEVDLLADDTKFCLDIGLLKMDKALGLCPANPIYREVMVRTLNYSTQFSLPASLEHQWMDGKTLDMTALLKEFQRFWQKNSEIWTNLYEYKEAAPHLILQAFLQRVLNGGGHLDREYALGMGRVDICAKYMDKAYPVEVKLAGSKSRERGLEQLERYLDHCGAEDGWLVIFDRKTEKSWDDRIFWRTETLPGGKTAHIVGC